MNNSQFRKLVLDTPARKAQAASPTDKSAQTSRNGATPSALGSRMRSSIPMTPRSIAGYSSSNDFARQLAERNLSSKPEKKFRSSAAPKGAKLAEGYVDRAKQRLGQDGEEEDDKVKRVKALEEMMKLQQIDEATFIKLRDEILGDEVGVQRAGLVKGLDWSMLERVKRGEVSTSDVLEGGSGKGKPEAEGEQADVDEEFEELEGRSVEAIAKVKTKKKGEMAPPALTGKKRNRDQILADLKAERLAAKEAAQPALGARFKKVGDRRSESRIERDSKGREVLITVDEDGNEKRKVRKIQPQEQEAEKEKGHGLLMPDKDVKPLGMEVPELPKAESDDEDINIFDDVGDDYDPLAGLGEDSSEEEEGEEGEVSESKSEREKDKPALPPPPTTGSMAPPPLPNPKAPASASAPAPSRNYFSTPLSSQETPSTTPISLNDPTLLAALKKASSLSSNALPSSPTSPDRAKAAKHARMLQADDRDAQDMDLSFGSSRFGDADDLAEDDGAKIKLSEWGKDGDGEAKGKGKGKGKGKAADRKRGPKKRKGDGESAADVLGVIERRRKGGE